MECTWILMNKSAWGSRSGLTGVVTPDGSIVIMGGEERGYPYLSRNDVWRSTDYGATWVLMNASAEWTPRDLHSSVVMPDGSIVLMGGRISEWGYINDVWRSTDNGATWTKMIANAGWLPREEFASVVIPDGSIMLMGGWTGSSKNDVWRSTDNGATWTQANASAGWNTRFGHSSVVIPDGSIVLMGGDVHDVWRLNPVGSSVQNPSHIYNTQGIFNVVLQAYNSEGFNSTRKMGYITVTALVSPVAIFTSIPTSGTTPLTVQFTDSSTGFPTAWNWSFRNVTGNNTQVVFSTLQNPSQTFGVGNYSIVLNASNSAGYNLSKQGIFINVSAPTLPPVARFTAAILLSNTELRPVSFYDTSTNTPTAWNWSFRNVNGNNTQVWFSTVQNPEHTFGVGNYSIVLNASNSGGYNLSTQVTFINVTTNTSTSMTKIGIYNAGNWYIDSNGDGLFTSSDKYIPYGATGWTHVVGDWNGDGISEIGIYKDAVWYIDYGGSGLIDANTRYYQFGAAGWTPIVGDWNADNKDEIGVYQNGNWYLDYNGNGFWDTGDKNYGFGRTGWTPVVGKWTADGISKIGVYNGGNWYIDSNGDGLFTGSDKYIPYGATGWTQACRGLEWRWDERDRDL